jgi:hypothetical protein
MEHKPETPEDCPICVRVEQAIQSNPILSNRLSEDEHAELVNQVKSAIMNKEIKKTTRGIQMSNEEKYVMNKSSFEDLYDTVATLISINEKMADRIERQDKTIMKALGIVAEHDSVLKSFGEADEMPMNYAEEEVEGEMPGEMGEGMEEAKPQYQKDETGALILDENGDPIIIEEGEMIEDEVPIGGDMPMEDDAMTAPPADFPAKMAAMEKRAFEAGFHAGHAELKKHTCVEVKPAEFTKGVNRPVPTADVRTQAVVEDMNKNMPSDKDLANMSTTEVNNWLRATERKR